MVQQRFATALLAAALALAGSAYGQESVGKGKEWDELVKAAQREGQVDVILSGQVPQKLRAAMPEFEKKYGVRVNFQTGSGRKHAERIIAERRLGRYTVDAWLGGANTALVQLIPNDVLQPFPELLLDPEVTDTSKWFQGKHHYTDPEGRYIFTWGATPIQNVSFNTDMVKPEEIKSYADLLDPKWKGKIVSWSPGAQGTGSSVVPLVLHPKVGYGWFERWANEMDVTIVEDARQGAEWVALGRFPIGMFGLNTQADALAQQGFPIQGWLPHPMAEGDIINSSAANLMAVDRAPHPNALKLFVNWALSRDAQRKFIEIGERIDTLRTDVPNDIIGPQYRIQPDVEYSVAFENKDYINKQTEIIENLRKIMRDAGYR